MNFVRVFAALLGCFLSNFCLAQDLAALSLSPTSVPSGTSSIRTVKLSAAAPAGGIVVALVSNAPAATVGESVTVPEGATAATFSIATHNAGYAPLTSTITASYNSSGKMASLTVNPGNYSSFIGQAVPASMVCGQTYAVSIQFKNTGTTTWDAAHYYKLQSRNPIDNLIWSTKRLGLANAPVAPGQIGTFSGSVIAPGSAGTYNFQWECIQDGQYIPFGPLSTNLTITTTQAADAARFVGQTSVLKTLVTGQTFTPTLTFRNVGTSTWAAAAGYVLKSRNPYANLYWGVNAVQLPANVAPNTNVNFTPALTAPTTPGTYPFQWSMIHNNGFGDLSANVDIVVRPPDNAAFVSQSISTSVYGGQQFYPQYTFKNTGGTTWSGAGGYWSVSASPWLNTVWTTNRCQLPVNLLVAPGQSVALEALVTAPSTPGVYAMQWQMSRNDVPFGDKTPILSITVFPPESAQCTAQTVPTTATAGQHYIAQVTFKNYGTSDWPLNTAIAPYPAFDGTWALKYLPTGSVVKAGNSRTYTLDLVAPYVAGSYSLTFRMRDMNLNSWFGQATNVTTVAVSPSSYAQSPWAGVRGGRNRSTGRGFGSGATGVSAWNFSLGVPNYFVGEPAIGADGTVYVGCVNHRVYALDGTRGAVKWTSSDLGTSVYCVPSIGSDGTVYVGSEGDPAQKTLANFVALDGTTGAQKWVYTSQIGAMDSAIGADGTIFFCDGFANAYALNGATGALKWKSTVTRAYRGAPAIGEDGTLYFATINDGLVAVDPSTGDVEWSISFSAGNDQFGSGPAIGVDGTIYLTDGLDTVYAVDPTSKSIRWQFAASNEINKGVALGPDGTVYFGSYDGNVYAVDGATGIQKWSFAAGKYIDGAPCIGADGTVYIAGDTYLYALNGVTGETKFKVAVGGFAASPALGADGTIYIGDLSGVFHAIK